MPVVLFSKNDAVGVYEAAGVAFARARRGEGPSLIEVMTDRLLGHFEGDPQAYRSKEEFELIKRRDAVVNFERDLVSRGVLREEEAKQVWDQSRSEVDEAIAFARTSPYPAPESALEHVFA